MLSIVLNISQNIEICKVQCPLDVPAHLCRVSKTSQRGDINWARHKSAFDLLRAAHMVHKVETSRSCSAQQDCNNTRTRHDRLNAPFVSCTGPTSVVTAKIWRGHLIDLDVKFRRKVVNRMCFAGFVLFVWPRGEWGFAINSSLPMLFMSSSFSFVSGCKKL